MSSQSGKTSEGDVVHSMVRGVISETPVGTERMMSAGIMVEMLVERGLPVHLAKRLYSQIRKGAPLHNEWREAFAAGRFHQRQGRATMPGDSAQASAPEGLANSAGGAPVAPEAKPAVGPSRASARQSAQVAASSNAPAPRASSMTFWLDPTFSEEGPEKETLNMFNNAADVMGTQLDGKARSPFDGFVEVGSSAWGENSDAFLLDLLPSPRKRQRCNPETSTQAANGCEAAYSSLPPHQAGSGAAPEPQVASAPVLRAEAAATRPLAAPAARSFVEPADGSLAEPPDELFKIVFDDVA